jgi:hypothetical protein
MVPVFRSLNLILSFPRLLENATAAIEPDFGRPLGPRLGSSRDITLQGVVRKAGRPLWGRTSAGVLGIARSAACRPLMVSRGSVLFLFSNVRPCSDGASAAGLRSSTTKSANRTIEKIQKPSKKLTGPSRARKAMPELSQLPARWDWRPRSSKR